MIGAKSGVEAAKWLGFVLMILDHANIHLLEGRYPILYLLGRLVFPLFALALAEGLARGGELRAHGVLRRLVVWACIAQIPWSAFDHSAGLNVLFALAAGLSCYLAIFSFGPVSRRVVYGVLGVGVAVAAEFGIAGLLVVVSSLLWREWPEKRAYLVLYAAALASLYAVNATFFAMAAPLVFFGLRQCGDIPRVRHLFYWMYPGHLVVLAFARYAL